MKSSIRLGAEPVRSLAFGSMADTYAVVGTALEHPSHCVILQNLTDVLLMVSIDGTNDNYVLPNSGQIIIDISTNRKDDDGFFISTGTNFYVRHITASAPTVGSVYVSTMYGAL